MKAWGRYAICAAIGIALGGGMAVRHIRSGSPGSDRAIGPWTTGADVGTARASAYTRAVVALRSLLALPVRNNIAGGNKAIRIAIAQAGQPVPDGVQAVRVEGARGVALLRVLVQDRAAFAPIDATRRQARCKSLG